MVGLEYQWRSNPSGRAGIHRGAKLFVPEAGESDHVTSAGDGRTEQEGGNPSANGPERRESLRLFVAGGGTSYEVAKNRFWVGRAEFVLSGGSRSGVHLAITGAIGSQLQQDEPPLAQTPGSTGRTLPGVMKDGREPQRVGCPRPCRRVRQSVAALPGGLSRAYSAPIFHLKAHSAESPRQNPSAPRPSCSGVRKQGRVVPR